MTGYSWISIIALLCYLFILLTFLAAGKKEKVLRTFVTLIAIMILWAGGSVAMRTELWPAVNFWHHVSVLGIVLAPAGYYFFVLDFLEVKKSYNKWFWLCVLIALFVANAVTSFFIPEPIVSRADGAAHFAYHYSWHIYILLAIIGLMCADMAVIIYKNCKGNRIAFRQLRPIIIGVGIVLFGHVAASLPIFYGIPLDILSGTINAIFIFYALYKKKLFKMTVLLSRLNCFTLSLIVVFAVFYHLLHPMQALLERTFGMSETVAGIGVGIFLVVCVLVLYVVLNRALYLIFIHREERHNARLEQLSEKVSHMLSVDDILQNVTEAAKDLLKIDRMMVFMEKTDGDYRVEYTTNPLEEKHYYLRADHPLVDCLKRTRTHVILRDFRKKTAFRSVWESEKKTLDTLNADVFVPMFCPNGLIGILMLPEKKDKSEYSARELGTVSEIAERCGNAVSEAYSYERAVTEARRDNLTGLVNRKYFFEILDRDFEEYKDTTLTLCLLNLDDFKPFNQIYGVHEGDLALQRVAGLLSSSVSEACTVARIGGKEFALLLPGFDVHFAKLITEKLAAEINRIAVGKGDQGQRSLTVSAGICAAPYMASSAGELFQNAEIAVYSVKRSGKNAVQVYSTDVLFQNGGRYRQGSGYKENAGTIYALTAAIDAKDHYTFQHSRKVAYYAEALGKEAGLSSDLTEILREAALLHDIGKIGIREDILNKPGKLSEEEAAVMKSHVENAVNIIRHLPSLDYTIPTVLSHHERYDGTGYPQRLKGEGIPLMGRILAIADSFDAMTSRRCYHAPLSLEEAINVLKEESGKQFDPKLTMIFIELLKKGKIKIIDEEAFKELQFDDDLLQPGPEA